MDFTNRAARPAQAAPQAASAGTPPPQNGGGARGKRKITKTFHSISAFVLLISVTIVILGVIGLTMFLRNSNESRFVAEDRMQAVFLNGGQVYFGDITTLNNRYLRLNNIYYLRVNQQVQPRSSNQATAQDIALVKLGCELHGPDDQMVINRDQIMFWENLKSDGHVAKAIRQYDQANNDDGCPAPQQGSANNDDDNAQDDTPATPAPAATPTPTP